MTVLEAQAALQDAGPAKAAEILLLLFRTPTTTPRDAVEILQGMAGAIASSTLEVQADEFRKDSLRMYGAEQVVVILRASARAIRKNAGIPEKTR